MVEESAGRIELEQLPEDQGTSVGADHGCAGLRAFNAVVRSLPSEVVMDLLSVGVRSCFPLGLALCEFDEFDGLATLQADKMNSRDILVENVLCKRKKTFKIMSVLPQQPPELLATAILISFNDFHQWN